MAHVLSMRGTSQVHFLSTKDTRDRRHVLGMRELSQAKGNATTRSTEFNAMGTPNICEYTWNKCPKRDQQCLHKSLHASDLEYLHVRGKPHTSTRLDSLHIYVGFQHTLPSGNSSKPGDMECIERKRTFRPRADHIRRSPLHLYSACCRA